MWAIKCILYFWPNVSNELFLLTQHCTGMQGLNQACDLRINVPVLHELVADSIFVWIACLTGHLWGLPGDVHPVRLRHPLLVCIPSRRCLRSRQQRDRDTQRRLQTLLKHAETVQPAGGEYRHVAGTGLTFHGRIAWMYSMEQCTIPSLYNQKSLSASFTRL